MKGIDKKKKVENKQQKERVGECKKAHLFIKNKCTQDPN